MRSAIFGKLKGFGMLASPNVRKSLESTISLPPSPNRGVGLKKVEQRACSYMSPSWRRNCCASTRYFTQNRFQFDIAKQIMSTILIKSGYGGLSKFVVQNFGLFIQV